MSPKTFISTVFLLILSFCATAQQKEYEFKNLTQENGLPSNESYFVYRDSKDYLWIATDQGVVRYNGNKMERFNLPDNVIFKIYEDSKGRVWFFSYTGKLAYFFNGAIYPYKYNNKITDSIKSILIVDAYVNDIEEVIMNSNVNENYRILKDGTIEREYFDAGIHSNKKNIYRISLVRNNRFFTRRMLYNAFKSDTAIIQLEVGAKIISYEISYQVKQAFHFGCVTKDRRSFYFFTGNILVKLNMDGSYKVKVFPYQILSLYADTNIWVGLRKQSFMIVDTNLNETYKDVVLKNKSVTSISKDHEGGMWFSTLENGIFYLKSTSVSRLAGDSTLEGPVFRLFNSDNKYILYANKSGIYKLIGNAIDQVAAQNSNIICDLFTDRDKNLYLAGTINFDGTFVSCAGKKYNGNAYNNLFVINSISELAETATDRYLVTNYGFVNEFLLGSNRHLNKTLTQIKTELGNISLLKTGVLFRDAKKQVWMGTINGLYTLNSLTSPFIKFKSHDTLMRKGVSCMRQLKNGIYTIGIRSGGIVLMQDTIVIANITEKNGLVSNSIKYLLPLNDQLWAATANGISVISFQNYNPVKYTITNIAKNEGLYNKLIYQLMPYQGNILAATSDGIYEINDPDKFIRTPVKPIPFYINSISYYKGDTSGINTITLPYKNNRIIVRYSAVCFNLAEEVKYYYRFDNRDTNWYEIASTELVMDNLIPGTYNLEIKAAIPGERRFSDVQKLQIIIEEPWWQSAWLIITGLLIIAIAVYLLYKNRIRKVTARVHEKTVLKGKMMELEQTALRAQMNPHFIFNCLTSIQQLVVTGNKTEANEYLVRFARLIRKTLEFSGRSFITIEEETNYLNEYLILEQLRIPGQFEFSIHTDSAIDAQKTEIPNMMLQPIVENSIRHGIKHLDTKRGYITIELIKADNHIICSITDNGIGRKKLGETNGNPFSENKSYGMDIVNKRLEALSFNPAGESMLDVEDLYDNDGLPSGTKVTMRLPFKTR